MSFDRTVTPSVLRVANSFPKVDYESATLDFDPAGNISGTSFRTSISRMKREYSRLSPSDKNRMTACVINIEEADLKPIMASVRIHSSPRTLSRSASFMMLTTLP